MGRHRGDGEGSDRGGNTAVAMVFLGLVLVTGALVGGFYVQVTGGETDGDPTKVEMAASTCTVTTGGETAGVGSVTLSARYRGNGSIDLSDASLRYSDERTESTLALEPQTSSRAASVQNESGVYDATITRGELLTIIVPVESVRGGALPAGERATLDLVLDQGTIAATSIRTPGGIGPDRSYVDC